MAGMQNTPCRIDHLAHRHLADHDIHLHLRQERDLHRRAAVILRLALLRAVAHDVGHGHTRDADTVHGLLQALQAGGTADDLHPGVDRFARGFFGLLCRSRYGLCSGSGSSCGRGSRNRCACFVPFFRQDRKAGISSEQAVFAAVHADDLVLGARPQADGLFDQQENNGDDDCGPGDRCTDAQQLDSEELESAAVEDALHGGAAGGEQAGQDRAQRAAHAVDGNRADRVVDLRDFIKEFNREHDREPADDADHSRPEGIHRVAARRDAHQAGQSRVEGHGNIRFAVTDPGEHHRHHGRQGGRQVRVEEDQRSAADRVVAVHGHRGSAVETEPAEPEDEDAQRGDAQVMTQDRPGFPVLSVLADAGPEDLRADQRAHAADHMHGRGTGEIMESHFRQPAAAPDPVAADRIDEQGDRCGVNAVGRELRALCHGAGYDGRRGGAEDGLEDGEGPQGNTRRKHRSVILHDEGIDPAEGGGACSEHNPETEQPVQRCADAEIHHVLHQDIACILGPGKAGFTHGKSGLHEEDQRCAQQHPDCVRGRVRHDSHFRFRLFPAGTKKRRRVHLHTLAPCWIAEIVYCIQFPVKGENIRRTMFFFSPRSGAFQAVP